MQRKKEKKIDQRADRTWVKCKTRVGTGSTSISTAFERRVDPSLEEEEEEEDGRFSSLHPSLEAEVRWSAANYNGGGSMRAVELLDQILQPLPLNPPFAPS